MKRKQTEILRRRVEFFKSRYSTAEEITDSLRSMYYPRHKRHQLFQLVQDELYSISNQNHVDVKRPRINIDDDDDEEEDYEDDDDENEEDEDRLQKNEASLQTTSASCDSSVFGLSGTESNGGMSEDEKEKEVKVSKKELGFKSLGGMKEIFKNLKTSLMRLRCPELSRELGTKPIGGILLHGLPGCGKTRLAKAIAYELGFEFYSKSATEFVNGVSGASEENIRKLFSDAKRTAPSVIFIDEIDVIASKRENLQRQMETRIVTQLMICMDEVNDDTRTSDDELPRYVLVIGATNKPDAIEPALRRPGRFDREILVGIPDESAREEILTVATRDQKLDGLIDLRKIAKLTPGFVGADLEALATTACDVAIDRVSDERERSQDLMSEPDEDRWKRHWSRKDLNKCAVTMSDFEKAIKIVQPSLSREGLSSIPNVKWEDIGALDLIREEFDYYIVKRIKCPEDYEGLGMDLDTGFLLYGPPGCGKTLIAQAVANAAGANFILVNGPELLNKYVGKSEESVRAIFNRARTCAPCIIFFDEVDALTKERGKEGGRVIEGVLNQLLVELDGAMKRKGVFVIGATNRPEVMDRAILRPGRFDKLFYVPLPSPDDRVKILKTLAKDKPVDASVDLSAIGRMKECDNFSGADLAALMREAYKTVHKAALKEKLTPTEKISFTIKTSHFVAALSNVSPSVSAKQRKYYKHISSKFLKAA